MRFSAIKTVFRLGLSDQKNCVSFQDDILFLYKAMDALVASNHAVNPVSGAPAAGADSSSAAGTPATAVTVTSSAAAAASGDAPSKPLSNGLANGRLNNGVKQRHSSSTGSLSNLEDSAEEERRSLTRSSSSRRHSLPPVAAKDEEEEEEEESLEVKPASEANKESNGCVIVPIEENGRSSPSPKVANGHSNGNEDEEEEDERDSETAALTADC